MSIDDSDITLPKIGVCSSIAHELASSADNSHVSPIIDALPTALTDDERQRAVDLIIRNADVFSRHEFDLGCTSILKYRIDTIGP